MLEQIPKISEVVILSTRIPRFPLDYSNLCSHQESLKLYVWCFTWRILNKSLLNIEKRILYDDEH